MVDLQKKLQVKIDIICPTFETFLFGKIKKQP